MKQEQNNRKGGKSSRPSFFTHIKPFGPSEKYVRVANFMRYNRAFFILHIVVNQYNAADFILLLIALMTKK